MSDNNNLLEQVQQLQKQQDYYMQTVTQIKGRLEELSTSVEAISRKQFDFDPVGLMKLPLVQNIKGDLEYHRMVNTIYIRGTLDIPSSAYSIYQFAQLPVGFTPKTLQKRSASGTKGHSALTIEITPNGKISGIFPPLGSPAPDEVFTIDISFHV